LTTTVAILEAEREGLMRALAAVTREKHLLIERETQWRNWLRQAHAREERHRQRVALLEAEIARMRGGRTKTRMTDSPMIESDVEVPPVWNAICAELSQAAQRLRRG
jgi:hypothetical protein